MGPPKVKVQSSSPTAQVQISRKANLGSEARDSTLLGH